MRPLPSGGGGREAHRHADRRHLGQRIRRRGADQRRPARSRRRARRRAADRRARRRPASNRESSIIPASAPLTTPSNTGSAARSALACAQSSKRPTSVSAPPIRKATRCSSSASRAAPMRRGRSPGWSPRPGSSRKRARPRRASPGTIIASRRPRAARPLGGSAEDQAAVAAHQRLVAAGRVRVAPPIEAVAVFDTVGSYGVPAGFGLAGLARLWTSWQLALPRHRAWRKRARRPACDRRRRASATVLADLLDPTQGGAGAGALANRRTDLVRRRPRQRRRRRARRPALQSRFGVDGGAAAGADRPRLRRRGDGGARRRRKSGRRRRRLDGRLVDRPSLAAPARNAVARRLRSRVFPRRRRSEPRERQRTRALERAGEDRRPRLRAAQSAGEPGRRPASRR